MPEGLSPIEAGKQLQEHTSEPHQPGATRHSRIVQIGEALLLSLVTIAAAWSGYAAAKWITESVSRSLRPPPCATWPHGPT
jgi:hypothetical protein